MELDPIEIFLQQGTKRFSLSLLINAHSRLSILQMNKGSISFEDIVQSLSLTATSEINPVELNAHAALIYEGTLVPILTSKGPVLRLNKEMIANDANFLKGVMNVMVSHTGSSNSGSNVIVDEFRNEASTFLKRSLPSTNSAPNTLDLPNPSVSVEGTAQPTSDPLVRQIPAEVSKASPTLLAEVPPYPPSGLTLPMNNVQISSPVPPTSATLNISNPRPMTALNPMSGNPASLNSVRIPAQFPPQVASPALPGRPNPIPARQAMFPGEEVETMPITDIERTEPVGNLLAHIRKEGMDILFPPIIHDKVLMAVFAAMRSAAPLAHRELIDMVMAVKEAAAVTQLENLSRNKVRGILALLKHAQLFVTHGADGDAVRLHLASGVNTFRDLRDRHDAFLNRYMILHHLFIPVTLKCDLIWQLDNETKNRRLEELKSLEFVLLDFFKTYYLGSRGLKVQNPPIPAAVVPNNDYGNYNNSNKLRYDGGEITDDRYRYLDQTNAAIYDPYRKPPTHPGQVPGNLVYSTARSVGPAGPPSVASIPSAVNRPYGAAPPASTTLSYNNQNYTPNYRSVQPTNVGVPPRVSSSGGYPRGPESEYGLSPQTFHKIPDGSAAAYTKGYPLSVDRGNGVLDGLTGATSVGNGGYNYYGLEEQNVNALNNDERYSMRSSLGHQSMNPTNSDSSLYGNNVGGLLSGGKKDLLSAFADPYAPPRETGSNWNVPFNEETSGGIKTDSSWATSSNWYSSNEQVESAPSTTAFPVGNLPSSNPAGPPPGLSNGTFVNAANGLSEAQKLDSLISDDQELVIPDPSTIELKNIITTNPTSEPNGDSETFPE